MKPIILSTPAYATLAENLSRLTGIELGELEIKYFPDGERYMRILCHIQDRDVYFICSSHSDDDAILSYDFACGFSKYGAKRMSLIMPYFGYSTMERAVKYGEIVTAKNRARLFSSIPSCSYGNRIYSVDLHSEGIPHYFEGDMQVFHIYANDLIVQKALQYGGEEFVLASTDTGRAKWVESLVNDCNESGANVTAAFIIKQRLSGSKTEVRAVQADVKGKTVVIYDDMIRTGGSLVGAAKAYKDAGADSIYCIATHGVLPIGSLLRLKESNLFEKIATSNSHPSAIQAQKRFPDFLEILHLEPLLQKLIFQKEVQ
jgi:ribose-phosphate pyrophosphokinase